MGSYLVFSVSGITSDFFAAALKTAASVWEPCPPCPACCILMCTCFLACCFSVFFPPFLKLIFLLHWRIAVPGRFTSRIIIGQIIAVGIWTLTPTPNPFIFDSFFCICQTVCPLHYLVIRHFAVPNSCANKKMTSYGGTTLNKPPIRLHVKILNFNGRFEAFSARYGMFLFHQPIQNRWKFNICFNVWVVFRLVFTVRACKQHPRCFWPIFKPQNVIPTSSHYTGLLS